MKNKSKVYYIQTEEEMRRQLMDRGLADTSFEGEGFKIEGEDMRRLCITLATLEDAVTALERRGINLRTHANRINLETGRLPVYHAFLDTREFWFTDRTELDEFITTQESKSGKALSVDTDADDNDSQNSDSGDDEGSLQINEFHEVRTINSALKGIAEFGFDIEALLPEDRTGIEEPRYILRRGDSESGLEDLRGLIGAVRAAGEKGIQVTRFKGLGEMNAEELRETTLDPDNRTLIQVKMDNVSEADDMFRILMGDKVEPRREFIEQHALDVGDLDI